MKIMRIVLSASIVLILLFSGCSNLLDVPEDSREMSANFSRVVTSREYYDPFEQILRSETGTLGPGADYMIVLPPGWQNLPEEEKKLLIYCHGYEPPGSVPDSSDEISMSGMIISGFVEKGFAVAYSSYSETGWAVKDGTIRTRQLRNYFLESIGTADDIFIYGVSEGALIALKLAEQNPELFSGVLADAGPIGGSKLEFEYIINTRLAFDHFYKEKVVGLMGAPLPIIPELAGCLASLLGYGTMDSVLDVVPPVPGTPFSAFIDPFVFMETMAPLMAYLATVDPVTAMKMATVSVDGNFLFPFNLWESDLEMGFTVLMALWYNIYGSQDLLERTGGRIPIDNSDVIYAYIVPATTIPAVFEVERMESARRAENYLQHWYDPIGILRIPVVTVHLTRDPAVPHFHEVVYGLKAAPYSSMLTQISVDGFGHGVMFDMSGVMPLPDYPGTMAYLQNAFFILAAQVEALSD